MLLWGKSAQKETKLQEKQIYTKRDCTQNAHAMQRKSSNHTKIHGE